MLYENISPKYLMVLIPRISEALWASCQSPKYQNVRRYIEKWHTEEWGGWEGQELVENFQIYFRDEQKREIDLDETLHKMPSETLIKIAIEFGIETPGFLPAIPTFKNVLKDNNQSAHQNFTRATSMVYKDPDNSVALAVSTLEGIIKTILEHKSFVDPEEKLKNLPLTKLVAEIIRKFKLTDNEAPKEIFTLAKQLVGMGTTLDDLRSDKSTAHGKGSNDYVIDDPLWAMMVVNTVAMIGLFVWEYFNSKYLVEVALEDELPDLSEIPF